MNLYSYSLTVDESRILQLGLTFCPDANVDQFDIIKDIHLFARRFMFKTIYHKPAQIDFVTTSTGEKDLTNREIQTIQDHMELWEENGDSVDSPFNPPLVSKEIPLNSCFPPPQLFKPRSRNFPTLSNNPNIWAFVQQITKEVEEMSCPRFYSATYLHH